ncbi:MAG: hypothetical protein WBQ68_16420, partial [Terriglobales bacterium]
SQWHVFSIRENKSSMGFRHLAPAGFVLILFGLIGASLIGASQIGASRFGRLPLIALISFLAVYLLTGFFVAVRRRREWGWAIVAIMPLATLFFHIAYGLGTLVGLRYLFKSPPSSPIRSGQPVNKAN